MAKTKEKEEALILRKQGLSISKIARKLLVSKSTVSNWCRDIRMTSYQIENIARESNHHATQALLRSAEKQRLKRQEDIRVARESGMKDVDTLTDRDIYMVGLGLYWGEGYKKGSQELGFTNSDPGMIKFYILWLKKTYNIEKNDLILRVSINMQHKHRIKKVESFWCKTTDVSLSQFTKPSLIKTLSTKKYKNLDDHFGTLRIKVRKGTQLRRRILGSIEALQIK